MARIPAIHLDTADLPPADRFAHWCGAIPTYKVSLVGDALPESFYALVDAWFVGGMAVTNTRLCALHMARPPERIAADGDDKFTLIMLREGSWTGDLDGRMLTAGPGQIVMLDRTRPLDAVSTACDSITLDMARAPVMAAAHGIDLHGLMFEGAVGRVLADHLMLLVRRLPELQDTEAAEVADATIGLIVSCIASSDRTRDDTAARNVEIRHRVFRHIDDHMARRDLTAVTICKQLGISRSVLYRAFAPLNGIAQYIRARRLEAAHVLLESPDVESRISEIAGRFGFVSDAHFSRAFRDRYGYNPRRARDGKVNGLDQLATVVGTHASPDVFKAWLRQIG
jgi:AraC-like DNA-binding protein